MVLGGVKMLEVVSMALAFAFIGFLLVLSYRIMEKERKTIKAYRKEFINALNNIANAIRGENN